MTDLANEAAATAAGYVKVQGDRGAGKSPRYHTEFHRTITGDPDGGSGANVVAGTGEHDTVQATADANALISLNFWRRNRYSQDANVSKGKTNTNAHTRDSS